MGAEDRTGTDGTAGNERGPDPSVDAVGVWLLFGTVTSSLALVSFYLSTVSGEYVFFSGWLVTFGYREFALVNAASGVLSFVTAYRFYAAESQ